MLPRQFTQAGRFVQHVRNAHARRCGIGFGIKLMRSSWVYPLTLPAATPFTSSPAGTSGEPGPQGYEGHALTLTLGAVHPGTLVLPRLCTHSLMLGCLRAKGQQCTAPLPCSCSKVCFSTNIS